MSVEPGVGVIHHPLLHLLIALLDFVRVASIGLTIATASHGVDGADEFGWIAGYNGILFHVLEEAVNFVCHCNNESGG